jgi:hypothetical protein
MITIGLVFLLLFIQQKGCFVAAQDGITKEVDELRLLVLSLAGRVQVLERTIESHANAIQLLQKQLADTQTKGRQLQALFDEDCLPKLADNVCVYDVAILFNNTSLVLDNSSLTVTGPSVNKSLDDEEDQLQAFFSRIFVSNTDVVIDNSNFFYSAETSSNGGNIYYNNTDVSFNSSTIVITGADPLFVNESLYDNETYAELFSIVSIHYTDVLFHHANVEFNESTVTHNNASSFFANSSIDYGNTETTYEDSIVVFEDTNVEYKGTGSLVSEVDNEFLDLTIVNGLQVKAGLNVDGKAFLGGYVFHLDASSAFQF